MRFKKQSSPLPEVNLVPMMDVLMTILTFFIIISMTLTSQQTLNINLPGVGSGSSAQNQPDPLVIGLNGQRQILLEGRIVNEAQLADQMLALWQRHPDRPVILKADKQLDYREVAQLLKRLRDLGGDRVSLAIEPG
ncbi:biopolymer transporter ExbD [Synechococcales cyanobacterium C]|uniref:Biopolymer transporter ExbD n=2 Tax=Petrachloros TaxID=2918834 RepID=A0A8K2A8M8_9CYAN|nr:biopolymer transporter ExbD [Petrachloros mirabilis ULC683]